MRKHYQAVLCTKRLHENREKRVPSAQWILNVNHSTRNTVIDRVSVESSFCPRASCMPDLCVRFHFIMKGLHAHSKLCLCHYGCGLHHTRTISALYIKHSDLVLPSGAEYRVRGRVLAVGKTSNNSSEIPYYTETGFGAIKMWWSQMVFKTVAEAGFLCLKQKTDFRFLDRRVLKIWHILNQNYADWKSAQHKPQTILWCRCGASKLLKFQLFQTILRGIFGKK